MGSRAAIERGSFYDLTSNGTAVHRSAELALRSATLELIERDAFMAWWYGVSSARPLAVLTTTLTAGYNMTGVGVGDYETVVLESRPGYFVLMCVVYVGGRDSPEGEVVEQPLASKTRASNSR